jgi:hypothetical protein
LSRWTELFKTDVGKGSRTRPFSNELVSESSVCNEILVSAAEREGPTYVFKTNKFVVKTIIYVVKTNIYVCRTFA